MHEEPQKNFGSEQGQHGLNKVLRVTAGRFGGRPRFRLGLSSAGVWRPIDPGTDSAESGAT